MNGINRGFSFAAMCKFNRCFPAVLLLLLASCNPESEVRKPGETSPEISSKTRLLVENIRKYPDSIGLYQALVDTLANSGHFAEAAAWCDSARMADSANTQSWMLVKADLFRLGKLYDSAIASYQTYLSRFEESEPILLNLANTFAEKGDTSCFALCSHIATRFPSQATRAKTAFIAGLCLNVKRQFTEARIWLDSAISLQYTFTEAWMERGYSLYDEKKFADAEKNFRQLTDINKGNAEAWYWMAKSAESAGKRADAISFYNRAYSLDASLTEAAEAVKRLSGK